MQNYIHGEFKSQYNVIKASNGNEAFEQAINEIPDIIISDIMMPGMYGLELCHLQKTDEPTSHIPIILLQQRIW